MPRIALVGNASWYLYNFKSSLINFLKELGYQVYAIAPRDSYSDKIPAEYVEIDLEAKGLNPIRDYCYYRALVKIFIKYKINVSLNFTSKPNIYSALASNKVGIISINNISGMGSAIIRKGALAGFVKFLYRRTQRKATHLLFQNQDDYKLFLEENILKRTASNIGFVPGSGVDTNYFDPAVVKPRKKEGSPFIFLLIARLLRDKGIVEYVEAAKILKAAGVNCKCTIVGFLDKKNPSSITEEELNDWIDSGLIEYLGSSDKIREEIAKADCIVLPSYREGTPRTLLEAASMAKPIIATNAVGCREVVKHNVNGFLCEIKSSADLAVWMKKVVYLDREKLSELGEAGRGFMIERFDESHVFRVYSALIDRYCKSE